MSRTCVPFLSLVVYPGAARVTLAVMPTGEDDHDREFPDSPRADYSPEGADPSPGLFATLKRCLKEFSEDNMTDWAAALTYYGVLVDLPGPDRDGVAGRPRRRSGADDQDDHRHRQPARPEVGGRHVRRADRVGDLEPGRVRHPADRRPRGRDLVGVGLRRRLHARGQHRLGDAGGPAVLEAQAASAAGDGRDDRARAHRRAVDHPHRVRS